LFAEHALVDSSDGALRSVAITVASIGQQELFPPPALQAGARGRPAVVAAAEVHLRQLRRRGEQSVRPRRLEGVANQPGDHYNPLFILDDIYGETPAKMRQVLDRNENARVVFLSSESFMNELIAALRRDRMDEFKARFRRVDVLIVDDVQFLAGRERTQEEFFHTFNSLYDGHHQIVLTSDKFPKEIPDQRNAAQSLRVGLIADIQPPDVETCIAILEKKAEFEGIELPQDVANFLATNIDRTSASSKGR
jgi:chromosomal replication initiator protein